MTDFYKIVQEKEESMDFETEKAPEMLSGAFFMKTASCRGNGRSPFARAAARDFLAR